MNKRKLAICDKNLLLRQAIRSLIDVHLDGFSVFETFLPEGLEQLVAFDPVLILLRQDLSASVPFAFCMRQIEDYLPNARKLVLLENGSVNLAKKAIRYGADGVLQGENSLEDFKMAVQQVAEGQMYLPEQLQHHLRTRVVDRNANSLLKQPIPLTNQELNVLRLVSDGLNSREAAVRLFISRRTVEMHLYRLYKKLNATNRTQALQAAYRLGILEVPQVMTPD